MRKIYLSLVSLFFIFNANAQLSGTVNVPSGGIPSLTNIGGLFDQINTAGISGDLVVKVTAGLSGETGTVALFATGIGIYKISIEPDMAALRTVSGSSAGAALIRFDGADRVTIDGRFSGSGNYIRIRNTENSAPALLLVNDAQNNSIRNTIIESGNAIENIQNTGGALQIGNSNVVNGFGNDNNIITYNEIRDRSDISGTSVIGILALGSTSATDIYNDNNVISNNNIHDFFSPASTVQAGVFIGVGNSRYNTDSNSIYQTASRTYTTTGAATRGISVVQPSATNNYGGYNIRNNYVGGTAPGGGINGAYWMLGISGNIINSFVGIGTSTGTLPNLIANNVIKNIDLTTVSPAFNANQFVGISAISGVYDITNNQVGAPTGTDSIKITVNTSSGANITANVTGIGTFNTPSTGYTVTGNKVGGIIIIHNTTGTIQAQLISVAGSPTTPVVINNNLIGSLTTPNSITISPSANRA